MVREIITLNVGQCGIQVGKSVWKYYCREHHIQPDGTAKNGLLDNDYKTNIFFEENKSGTYTPRDILCDLDNDTVENIVPDKYSSIFNSENIITGKKNGANIYSRGYFGVSDIIDNIKDRLRKVVNNCDNIQGFIINHSITGASGSGLTTALLEKIVATQYRKKGTIGIEICPRPAIMSNIDGNILDPYNMILSLHNLLDWTDISVLFDNVSLHNVCRDDLGIFNPTYNQLNQIISTAVSGFTATFRLENDDGHWKRCDNLNDCAMFHAILHRLHFLTPCITPIKLNYNPITLINGFVRTYYDKYNCIYDDIFNLLYKIYDIKAVTNQTINISNITDVLINASKSNFLMDYAGTDFNDLEDKYLSCFINYRTTNEFHKYKNMLPIIRKMRTNPDKMLFYEGMCSGGNGTKCHRCPPYAHCVVHNIDKTDKNDNSSIAPSDLSAVMTVNNTHLRKWIKKRVIHPFHLLYDNQRTFTHWYRMDGLEDDEFEEAREDVQFLMLDYWDIVKYAEESTDYGSDDDD